MAITVDWSQQPWVIEIPQSDLTLVSGTRYQITVDFLWQLLRDFSDGPEGSANQLTYRRVAATASTPPITEINDPFYACQFEDGLYSVDIIDGNSNFRDVEVKNQVSVGTNNTTGFINPTFLELGLFGGAVTIDAQNATGNAVAGTDKTAAGGIIGTRQTPVNNIADAETIATTRGLHQLNLVSNLNIASQDLSEGYLFTGDSPFIQLTVDPGADVSNCAAQLLNVSGEMDGFNTIRDCTLGATTGVSGFLEKTALQNSLTLNGDTAMFETYSQVPGTGYPTIITGSSDLVVRDHHGSIGLAGITGGTHSIGVYGGRIVIESSCTGGSIYLRGEPYEIVDNSGAGCTVVDQTSGHKTSAQYRNDGLEAGNPVTITPTSRKTADNEVDLALTGNGIDSTTVTRQ